MLDRLGCRGGEKDFTNRNDAVWMFVPRVYANLPVSIVVNQYEAIQALRPLRGLGPAVVSKRKGDASEQRE